MNSPAMNEIVKNENKEENINLLAAQRQMYSDSKKIYTLQIVLITLVPVILSIINIYKPISEFLSFYVFFFSIIDVLFIENSVVKKKELAAQIQELFDINVLGVSRNPIIDKPDPEIIYRYSTKYKKNNSNYLSELSNWYPEPISNVSINIGISICQRSNCSYDKNLRKGFNWIISLIISFCIISILLVSLFNKITLANVILTGLIPILPMILFLIKLFQQNKKSINSINILKCYITNELEDVQSNDIDMGKIRNLQNLIYNNRIQNPLIFDIFYNILRNKSEEELVYSIKHLVEKVNER